MFRKAPFAGWLLPALLLWCIAGVQYHVRMQSLQPAWLAAQVNAGVQGCLAQQQILLADTPLLTEIIADKLSGESAAKLRGTPYYIFAFAGDRLLYWNNNTVLPGPPAAHVADSIGRLTLVSNKYCVERVFQYGAGSAVRSLILLCPVAELFEVENAYLKPGFTYAPDLPLSTGISTQPSPGAFPLSDGRGHVWCYLTIHPEDIPPLLPDGPAIALALAALFFSVLWLQLMAVHLCREHRRGLVAALIAAFVVCLRILLYRTSLPFHLGYLKLFSPQLYGFNVILPSLGDLLINVLCLLWLLIFILAQTPFRTFLTGVKNGGARIITAVLLALALAHITLGAVAIIRSVVIDSQLSFDVGHFHTVDGYTIIGLFTLGLLLSVVGLFIHFINNLLSQLAVNGWMRGALVLACALACTFLYSRQSWVGLFTVVSVWLALFVLLVQVRRLVFSPTFFSLIMVFWLLVVTASAAALLYYLTGYREAEKDQAAFAARIASQDDPLMEFTFRSTAVRMAEDPSLAAYLDHPDDDGRKMLDQRLNTLYLNGPFNRYQPGLYLFDSAGHPLFNEDTASLAALSQRFAATMPAQSDSLKYDPGATDGHNYLGRIPVSGMASGMRGVLFIDLALRKVANETVYPELLQPSSASINAGTQSGYAYAVYNNGRLITQSSEYSFPVQLPAWPLPPGTNATVKRNGRQELWYPVDDHRLVIVVGPLGGWIGSVTLFSYLFGVMLLLAGTGIVCRRLVRRLSMGGRSGHTYTFTLRRRIHLSMQAIVLVSFIIIGAVSIAFFNYQYQQSNTERLQTTVQHVERSIEQYLMLHGGMVSGAHLDSIASGPDFRYTLADLAANLNVDASLFATDGTLLVASQEDIYNKGLLARIMRPDAFRQMREGRSLLLQEEGVGSFSFLSSYVPLHNTAGRTLGYINVPFFSSEKELNDQISGIVVTLINLYAFLFLLSSLLAVVITRWLTGTLNIIIHQFGRINLHGNELLVWPYEDEIGMLVKEYNHMVRKVEESATLLAQSEREGAWREMARQVAHEIKNPLTPMKLNIQYLQQALRNNQPNVAELAGRVSASMMEQIDNLSYIASEFSNFAKMPEARPELLALDDLLQKEVDLFEKEPGMEIIYAAPHAPVHVMADKSQVLRVLTNLLQNAVQAIPDDGRQGRITAGIVREAHHALISVQDNGQGISEEARDRIFKPYFTTKSSGTGLGLAMTRKIVELWKGSIWFETEEDIGTTFFIRIPVVEKSEADERTEQ